VKGHALNQNQKVMKEKVEMEELGASGSVQEDDTAGERLTLRLILNTISRGIGMCRG
jgi:hypothetical protein